VNPTSPQRVAEANSKPLSATSPRSANATAPATLGTTPSDPATLQDTTQGLSSAEAQRRLSSVGPNTVADTTTHPLKRVIEKLWAPVPWMLEAAIVFQFALGDDVGAGIVLLLLLFNAGIGFFQESQSQSTVAALKKRLALIAAVRRDGHWTTLAADALVPGDIVKLSLGTVVAADVRLISGEVLLDQSMLTGESAGTEGKAGTLSFAGALVRRGEAVAEVIATGPRTKFGRTAELVRIASVQSSQQKTVLRVVRNLFIFNGGVTVLLSAYAFYIGMPLREMIPLLLVALLASIPVALPSMFSLASAVGARSLTRQGVLPTSLSSVDEAGGIDILCADKTGTLTQNALTVISVHALSPYNEARVLQLAALASSDGGQDPVDAAIRVAAAKLPLKTDKAQLLSFTPFDPAKKRAEATAKDENGQELQVFKGAYDAISGLTVASASAAAAVAKMEGDGYRVLAVASGPPHAPVMTGLIAMSDPPRTDSAALVSALAALGVKTVMVTGDALKTAQSVAAAVGIKGAAYNTSPIPADLDSDQFAIFASVLPEDKFSLVKGLQHRGHLVGMCGDGANDAPALRQAQMGIAVATATDVAKSAAGVVLTEPGLEGVVALVKEGRVTFQRVLTYTLRSIVHKIVQVLFLAVGLMLTGRAILTPALMVLMMVTGDFLAMSSATDNVRASPLPNVWRIKNLTIAGVVLGLIDLIFCVASLLIGKLLLHLDTPALQTLTVVTLVFSGQAVFYVSRERQHLWSSVPGKWLMASSVVDIGIVTCLATQGWLMKEIPLSTIGAVFCGVIVLALLMDAAKHKLFARLQIY